MFLLIEFAGIHVIDFRFGFLIYEKKTITKFLCVVDGVKKHTKIIEVTSEKEIHKKRLAFIIKTPIYVFNDCNAKKMHNTFTPSKLLEIIILKGSGRKNLEKYFRLVDLYENDSLPFYKLIKCDIIYNEFMIYSKIPKKEYLDLLIVLQ